MPKFAHTNAIKDIIFTNKSSHLLTSQSSVVCKVPLNMRKKDIFESFKVLLDGISPISVNTMRYRGKKKNFRGRIGRRSDYKKAIVRFDNSHISVLKKFSFME